MLLYGTKYDVVYMEFAPKQILLSLVYHPSTILRPPLILLSIRASLTSVNFPAIRNLGFPPLREGFSTALIICQQAELKPYQIWEDP